MNNKLSDTLEDPRARAVIRRVSAVLTCTVLSWLAGRLVVQYRNQVLALGAAALLPVAWQIVGFPGLVFLCSLLHQLWFVSNQFTIIRLVTLMGAFVAAGRSVALHRLPRSRVLGALIVFGAMLALQLLYTPELTYARQALVRYIVSTLLLGLGLLGNVRSRSHLSKLLVVVLIVGILDGALTIYQAVTGDPLIYSTGEWFTTYEFTASASVWASGFGVFPHSRGDNAFLIMLPLLIAVVLFISKLIVPRAMSLACIALFAVALVMTNYRTAIAASILGIVLCFILMRPGGRERRSIIPLLVIGIILFAVGSYLWAHWGILGYRFDPPVVARDYRAGRSAHTLQGLRTFATSPLFGVGVGMAGWIHNGWVMLLAETGIVGETIWAIAVLLILKRYWDVWRRIRDDTWCRAVLVAFGCYLVAYLVSSWTGSDFRSGWIPATFAYLMPDMVESVANKRAAP